jgi:transposase-like protein
MPPRKRWSYTAEYKVEAAHRVIDPGRTISEVARELGIDPGMLSVWVKDERRRGARPRSPGTRRWRRLSGPSCCGYAGRWANWRRTTPSW